MASMKSLSRLCSRLQPVALKLNKKGPLSPRLPASAIRTPRISRLSVVLSSMETMLPLHSAIASARLTSSLSSSSQCWGLIPQGISLPL